MWLIALLIVGVVAIDGLPIESRYTQYDELFGHVDENGDGFTSKSELEKFGLSWATSAVFDLNNDGKLSRTEFNIMVFMSNAGVKETNCFNHFRAADNNRDGLISDQELANRMTKLGKAALPIFEEGFGSLGMAREIIQAVDKNGDRKLDYFEFKKVGFEVCQSEWPSSV